MAMLNNQRVDGKIDQKLIKISHKPLRVAYNSHFQQELLVQGTLKYKNHISMEKQIYQPG